MSFTWKLPNRPDSPKYREILAMIEAERERDPIKAMIWFRAVAESDFWFWQRHVMPFGTLRIQDKYHKKKGQLVIDQPWMFDRMREVQEDFVSGRSNVLYMWFRGSYKSTTIIKGGALWFLANDPSETVAVFTHKVEQTGENMGNWYVGQIRNNQTLLAHWPQFRKPRKLSDTLIIVDRPEGAHEPSLSIHPILGSAAGGHFTKILVDDAVTEKIAYSVEDCKRVENALSFIQPLRRDNTQYFYVGTPYTDMDPVWRRAAKGAGPDRFFRRISRHPAILAGNDPQLFSLRYFRDAMRDMDDFAAQSQYMLRMVPKGGAYFKREWIAYKDGRDVWRGRMRGTPEANARGCRIHVIVDMAGGETATGLDYSVARVYGFTYDRRRLVLDLWREKIGLTDMADLLFGVLPGDELLPENAWKPQGGLVRRWQRVDPDLTIWVEEIGASGHAETFRREMSHRKRMSPRSAVSCMVRELKSQRKKESRIAKLQPTYRNGLILYPEDGFGHGSFTAEDERDTFEQFLEDELKGWTLSGDTLNDDMLDTEAWPEQPESKFSYPDVPPEVYYGTGEGLAFESTMAREGGLRAGAPSWRVF